MLKRLLFPLFPISISPPLSRWDSLLRIRLPYVSTALSLGAGPSLAPKRVLTPRGVLRRSALDELDQFIDIHVSLLANLRLRSSDCLVRRRRSSSGGSGGGRSRSGTAGSLRHGGAETTTDAGSADLALGSLQSLHLAFFCLSAGGLLPLNVLDDSSEKLDVSEDLLRLAVIGAETFLEDGVRLFGGGKGGGNITGEEVSLGELV